MPITTEQIISLLKDHPGRPVKLRELCQQLEPELPTDSPLPLENIDFYRIGSVLHGIDFSNCTFKNCDFRYLEIVDCIFPPEAKGGANFTGTYQVEGSSDQPQRLNQQREECRDNWEKLLLQKHPSDILQYQNLATLHVVERAEGFFTIINPKAEEDAGDTGRKEGEVTGDIEEKEKSFLGWKLHISIEMKHLPAAFNAIAPILYRNGIPFKVLDNEREGIAERFKKGAQFTIYLEENGQAILQNPNDVGAMIAAVDAALRSEHIDCGIIPQSDAKIEISPYFSIRNDKILCPAVLSPERDDRYYGFIEQKKLQADCLYMEASLVGTNFNPCNLTNPYAELLAEKHQITHELLELFSTQFDARREDQSRPVGDSANYFESVAIALLAYLYEHTNLEKYANEQLTELVHQVYSWQLISSEFIKPNFANEANIQENIRWAFMICDYIFHRRGDDAVVFHPNLPPGKLSDFLRKAHEKFESVRTEPRDKSMVCESFAPERLGVLINFHKNHMLESLKDKPKPELISAMIEEMKSHDLIVAMAAADVLTNTLRDCDDSIKEGCLRMLVDTAKNRDLFIPQAAASALAYALLSFPDNAAKQECLRTLANNVKFPAIAMAVIERSFEFRFHYSEKINPVVFLEAIKTLVSAQDFALPVFAHLDDCMLGVIVDEIAPNQPKMAIEALYLLAEHGMLAAQFTLIGIFTGTEKAIDPLSEIAPGARRLLENFKGEKNLEMAQYYLGLARNNPLVTPAGKEELKELSSQLVSEPIDTHRASTSTFAELSARLRSGLLAPSPSPNTDDQLNERPSSPVPFFEAEPVASTSSRAQLEKLEDWQFC
jgi:hypothetical protein